MAYRKRTKGPRKPKPLPIVPDFRDLDKLIRATRRERDRLILMLARYMGLRVSEICKLKVEHLDFGRNFLMVREGKGKKDRCAPIPTFLVGPLRGWIQGKGRRPADPVFLSPYGGHLRQRGIQAMIKRVAVQAGLADALKPRFFTTHKFRHQFCSTLLAAGVPVHEARDLMGHSSIAITDRYSHSTPEHLRSAIERAK